MTPEQAQGMLDYYDKMSGFDLTWEEIAGLLKQLANLHYEYAVLLEDIDGTKRFAKGSHTHTSHIDLASWSPSPNEVLADFWRENVPELKVSIIRRLKGYPEVTE